MFDKIIILDWPAAKPLAAPIRQQVFIVEQGVPENLEWDADDALALHFLAVLTDGSAVGTTRLLPDGRIGRMAVLPPWRGCGLGKALLAAAMAAARARGQTLLSLHAQIAVRGFYEQAGFVARGEVFEEAGIAHLFMSTGDRK